MSYRDPIVEEVWRLRAEAWAPFGEDIHAYFEHLRREAQNHPERTISAEEFKRRYRSDESDASSAPTSDENISRAS